MNEGRSDRLAAGAGILAAILMVAGFVLIGVDAPGSDSSRSEIVSAYSDDGTNARQAIGVLLTGLGGVLFLPFVSYVRSLLDRTGGAAGLLPSAAFAGGILLVAGLFTGAVLSSAVSAGDYFDGYRVDADIAMTAVAAGFYFNGLAAMAGGVLIGAASLASRRTGLLPGWLAIVGYVVAVASIPAALAGMWIIVEALWIVLAAGVFAARASRVSAAPVAGAAA